MSTRISHRGAKTEKAKLWAIICWEQMPGFRFECATFGVFGCRALNSSSYPSHPGALATLSWRIGSDVLQFQVGYDVIANQAAVDYSVPRRTQLFDLQSLLFSAVTMEDT